MLSQLRSCCAIAIAVSLIAAPTGALAASPAAARPSAPQPIVTASVSPWLALSAMTSSSSGASAATAAAQQEGAAGSLAEPSLAVILSTIALAIWTSLEDHDGNIDLEPISP